MIIKNAVKTMIYINWILLEYQYTIYTQKKVLVFTSVSVCFWWWI